MSGLREVYGLSCPQCGRDSAVEIVVKVLARLTAHGEELCGESEWTPESACRCCSCGHTGDACDFMAEETQ